MTLYKKLSGACLINYTDPKASEADRRKLASKFGDELTELVAINKRFRVYFEGWEQISETELRCEIVVENQDAPPHRLQGFDLVENKTQKVYCSNFVGEPQKSSKYAER